MLQNCCAITQVVNFTDTTSLLDIHVDNATVFSDDISSTTRLRMVVLHFYSTPGLQAGAAQVCRNKIQSLLKDAGQVELKTEICYNVEVQDRGRYREM